MEQRSSKGVIVIVRTQLWGEGVLPNARKGDGVHGFAYARILALKDLQFWVVLMERLYNLKSKVTSIEQFSLNFVTFIHKVTQCI